MRARLAQAILEMAIDPRRGRSGFHCRKMRGSELWRVRVGHWRMTYTIADAIHVVDVTEIGPRENFYD